MKNEITIENEVYVKKSKAVDGEIMRIESVEAIYLPWGSHLKLCLIIDGTQILDGKSPMMPKTRFEPSMRIRIEILNKEENDG